MPALSPKAVELITAAMNGERIERFAGNTEVRRVEPAWEDVDMDEAVALIAQACYDELEHNWRVGTMRVTKAEALNALSTLSFGRDPTSVMGEAARTLNLYINQQ